MAEITPDPDGKLWFIHKYETCLRYAGPEEGGRYYDHESAIPPDHYAYEKPRIFNDEEEAFAKCRELHEIEYKRRDAEGANYTSVLAYKWDFFCYDVSNSPEPKEESRVPMYE